MEDFGMSTLVEDIHSLTSLFQLCSVCLTNTVNMDLCISISGYAVGILLDEERIYVSSYVSRYTFVKMLEPFLRNYTVLTHQ